MSSPKTPTGPAAAPGTATPIPKYRVISRTEITFPPRAGQAGPVLQISWEFVGHVPRIVWIAKKDWTQAKEDQMIQAEITRIQGRTPLKAT